jgi:prevent-host-death family protein
MEAAVGTVTVKETRQKLREILDRAQAGEEILIVRRGRPVAKLVPLQAGERPLPDLTPFRASIRVRGAPLRREVLRARREARA